MEITVKPGDTLTKIAAANPGTTPVSIANANGIKNIDEITVGQVLQLPDVAPEAVIPGEEPGVVPEAEENELLEKVFDSEKTGQEEVNKYDKTGALVTGDYSAGKFTGPGIEVDLEGGGDLDTTKRDFFGETVTETEYGTSKVDLTAGSGEGLISEAAGYSDGVTKAVPGEDALPLGQKPEVAEVKPSIDEAAIPKDSAAITVSATTLDKVAPPGKDIPPTESELATLIASFTPMSTGGKKVYEGVITALKGIEFDNTEDAQLLYQQLSEDAERDTKKIDDSIAEIAAEKMKPTFEGWNKFLAVLGAAMGAYGSSMTGTPNFALQIMNRAIDADREQFLASQEIRTKSLLEQRKAVLQRRSDLLQLGLNEADKMLKVAQKQQDKQIQIANVQGVIDGIENAAIETKNEQTLVLIDILSKKAAATLLKETAQKKDFRERTIEAVTLKDGKGDLIDMPEYLAKTPAEGAELRKTSGFGSQIQDVLNKLDALSDKTSSLPKSALLPSFVSETRTKVRALANELIIKLKDFYGMGANFTEYEQELIQALTPTDKWLEKWGMWKVKSNNLRDTIVRTHRSMAAAQGAKFAQMPIIPKKGKAKGQTTIYKAP
jgi:hypothetical protein